MTKAWALESDSRPITNWNHSNYRLFSSWNFLFHWRYADHKSGGFPGITIFWDPMKWYAFLSLYDLDTWYSEKHFPQSFEERNIMMFVVDNTPTQIALLFCFNDVFYERGLCNVSMSAWLSYHNKSLLDASNLDWIIA